MTNTAEAAIALIDSNPRDLTARGHALLNAHVKALLADGRIAYAPERAIAYRVVR